MARGDSDKREIQHSELTEALIKVSVLEGKLKIYKSFADQVYQFLKPHDDLHIKNNSEVEIENLVYLMNLLRRKVNG